MPLTSKGSKILSAMSKQYGSKKGKSVFYASINKGKLKGVEGRAEGGSVRMAMMDDPRARKGADQFGNIPSGGGGGGGGVPQRSTPIRSQKSLERALREADSDDELIRIRKLLEKRGYSTDSPQFGFGNMAEGGRTPTQDELIAAAGALGEQHPAIAAMQRMVRERIKRAEGGPVEEDFSPYLDALEQRNQAAQSPAMADKSYAFRLLRQHARDIPQDPERAEALAETARSLPVGGLIGAGEDIAAGEYSKAVPHAIAGLTGPLGAAAKRAAMAAVNYAPKAAASVAGLFGAGAATPTEAVKLTREQQRQVEMDRQATELKAQAERERIKAEGEAARQRGENEAKIRAAEKAEQTRIDRENIAAAETARLAEIERVKAAQEAHEKLPFRERHPDISNLMTAGGMSAAAAVPFGGRMVQAGREAIFNSRWRKVVDAAEAALKSGDTKMAKVYGEQLKGFAKQSKEIGKSGPGAVTTGAAALSPLEVSMLPEQIDMITGEKEAKQKAMDQLLDWHRAPGALLQGATFATLGMKAPTVLHSVSPAGRSEGLVKSIARSRKKEPVVEKAAGGPTISPDIKVPWAARSANYALRAGKAKGPVIGTTPGRADQKAVSVDSGSYVVPADIVSAIGQGNSAAGHKTIGTMFSGSRTKYGGSKFKMHGMSGLGKFAAGGTPSDVPIAISDGEHVIAPEEVLHFGDGDMKTGHDRLDKWVLAWRQKNIKQLKRLKGPKKD